MSLGPSSSRQSALHEKQDTSSIEVIDLSDNDDDIEEEPPHWTNAAESKEEKQRRTADMCAFQQRKMARLILQNEMKKFAVERKNMDDRFLRVIDELKSYRSKFDALSSQYEDLYGKFISIHENCVNMKSFIDNILAEREEWRLHKLPNKRRVTTDDTFNRNGDTPSKRRSTMSTSPSPKRYNIHNGNAKSHRVAQINGVMGLTDQERHSTPIQRRSDPKLLNTTNQHNNQHKTVLNNDDSASTTTATCIEIDDDEEEVVVLPPSSSSGTTAKASTSSSEVLYLHMPLIPFTMGPLDFDDWSEKPIPEPPALTNILRKKDSLNIYVKQMEDVVETNQISGVIVRSSMHPHGTKESTTAVRLLCLVDGQFVHEYNVKWHKSDYHELKRNGITFVVEFAHNQFQAAAVDGFRVTLIAQEILTHPNQLAVETFGSMVPVYKSSFKTIRLPPLPSAESMARDRQCYLAQVARLNETMIVKGTRNINDLDSVSVAALTEINKADNAVRRNLKSSGATSSKLKPTLETFDDDAWVWRPPQDPP